VSVKDSVKHVLAARQRRARRMPALKGGPSSGKIYLLCPDHAAPSGGVRTIYRFADVLVEAGLPAAVLHHRNGFAAGWFEHRTPIVYARDARLGMRDVLVVPEIYGPTLDTAPSEPKLVVFNQNAYLTFDGVPRGHSLYEGVSHLLVVSDDNAEYLRFAFPDIPVTVIPQALDPALFHPVDATLPRRIAYMPRKRAGDAEQAFAMLGARMAGWGAVPIDGRSSNETAAILRTCPLFLSLSSREGFGLPPAEAMASGCYVVGFPGLAGREFMLPEFSRPVAEDDVHALAVATADVMRRYEDDPVSVRVLGAKACEYVRSTYSAERQRDGLVAFFAPLLG
jgi:glycosyltransferase involved in cell wall biosynthesis